MDLTNVTREPMRRLLASATSDASAAMCRWTDGLVTLALDEVESLPLEEACAALGLGEDLLTMIVLTLGGARGGAMLLVFDEESGRRLAASLLRRSSVAQGAWTVLEQSALTETGNILGCAYMNALTRWIGAELIPSAPYFLQDYGASVVEQALLAQAIETDRALVCRTVFRCEGEDLSWRMLFLPSPGLRAAMEAALNDGERMPRARDVDAISRTCGSAR